MTSPNELADYYQNLELEIGEPLGDADRLRNDCIVLSRALLSATQRSGLPDAWLEIDHDGNVMEACVEKDLTSPFKWKPLYLEAPQPATQRRDGHAALRVRDGKMEVFDPNPKTVDAACDTWQQRVAALPVLPPNTNEAFKAGWHAALSETPAGGTAKEPEGWIPVGERLPTHIHSVLMWVVNDHQVEGEPYREIGIYNATRAKWQMNFGDDDIDVEVTHWMPLPAAPSPDGNDNETGGAR
jgi:hypothetical protein